MMYAGRFKFLKNFHRDGFEKLLNKAVKTFKVWGSRSIPARRKFSKGVFGPKKCVKQLKMVLGCKYGVCRAF